MAIAPNPKQSPPDAASSDAVAEAGAPTLLQAITKGLALVDAADKACPINKSRRFIDVCPKCGATDDQGCGLNIRALCELEALARTAVSTGAA